MNKSYPSDPANPQRQDRIKKDFDPRNRIDKEKQVLTRPFDKHLDNDELDGLVSSQEERARGGQVSDDTLEGARKHIESCADCGRRVGMHRQVQREISELHQSYAGHRDRDCPEGVDWLSVAAGLLPAVESRKLMSHASQCDHCGPLLREASADLSEDASPQELQMLNELLSANEGWQQQIAKKMTNASHSVNTDSLFTVPWRKGFFAGPRLVWSGVFAALIAIACWFGVRAVLAPDVNELLAKAYTEARTMELRIPYARYAPLRIERGAKRSTAERSQALLDADALISHRLRAHPNDPRWLQAKARSDLLEFQYDSALESLQRALDQQPNSPSLLTDLATAYYQRAVANGDRESDYGKAVDYLGRALAQSPDDPVALFNRAVSEEKLHLYEPAINDWEHYLRIDPSGPWADEARQRLEAVRKKVSDKAQTLKQPLLPVKGIVSLARNTNSKKELEERIEDYLHIAVKEWLPQAFPRYTGREEAQRVEDAQTALAALAAVARDRHGDLWLTDLLATSHTAGFQSGIILLSAAVRSNDNGDYSGARKSAHEAVVRFQKDGNIAAEIRALAEEAYSDHLLYDGGHCYTLVRSVDHQLEYRPYEWLRAQMSLEESSCAGLLGDFGTTKNAVIRGTNQAEAHHYPSLFLRGLGFQADSTALLGDTQESFALASRGLEAFWSDKSDVMKGYNLYTDLDTAADILHLSYLQVALWSQATSLIDLHPDVVQRAMAHRWFADAAYLANMTDLAGRESAKASSLFAAAPPTEATRRGKMDADIWLAGLQARQGDLDQAAAQLEQVERDLKHAPAFSPEIGFYTTQAELSLRRGDSLTTESSLRSAIFLAEWALTSFPSQRARRQWSKQSEPAYRNLVAWRIQQGDVQGALELWEWYRGAEFRQARGGSAGSSEELELSIPPDAHDAPPVETPSVVTDRLSLLSDRTFITYAVFRDGIAVWVFDDRGFSSHWIVTSRAELASLAAQFQRLCSTPNSNIDALRTTAQTLYELLIAPVQERFVSGRTLVFEPDDVFSSIPLEALVDREGHYLAERSTIVVAPGFYKTLHLRKNTPIVPESPVLVVSVPAPAEERLPPLADAGRELETVAKRFQSPQLLTGQSADLVAIRRELSNAKVFHFVGHAVALPEINGLLLAERDAHTGRARLLNAETIKPEGVQNLELAVLSACDTGLTPDTGNSGSEGLTQALLSAGVSDVVASRWSVDSTLTTMLMQNFYEQLLEGKGVAVSLRKAQVLLMSQPASAHPYYWAAFGVQGL